MEVEKTPKAALERGIFTGLLIGYGVVLAFIFMAFGRSSRCVKVDLPYVAADVMFEGKFISVAEIPEQQASPPFDSPKKAVKLFVSSIPCQSGTLECPCSYSTLKNCSIFIL